MNMRVTGLCVSVIWIICLGGCATRSSMLNAPPDAGHSQTYNSEYKTLVKAARDAVVASGLAIDNASEVGNNTFVIVGKKDASVWSWGELVRVTVQGASESETTVRVYTKRRLATNVTARGDWADTVFSNIALQLR